MGEGDSRGDAGRKMPPWFADPCCGKFSNDRSLTEAEIATLDAWATTGAAEGDAKDAPKARGWAVGWNLPLSGGMPDQVVEMPRAFDVPAKGAVEYQYFAAPTGFQEDRWVQGGGAAGQSRGGASRGGVYSRAGIDVDGRTDEIRHLDGVGAGELARSVAARDGQAGEGRLRSGI